MQEQDDELFYLDEDFAVKLVGNVGDRLGHLGIAYLVTNHNTKREWDLKEFLREILHSVIVDEMIKLGAIKPGSLEKARVGFIAVLCGGVDSIGKNIDQIAEVIQKEFDESFTSDKK